MLSEGIGSLWIEGEISNFACPASGHWYFTLKDERAQCRAAMFKGRNNRVGFLPKNGQHVLIRAQVTLYEARGEFQLVVEHLEDAGVGELMRRYEALKAKLGAEGLFANELKRPLPYQPHKIAIVTSPTGAAIRDVLVRGGGSLEDMWCFNDEALAREIAEFPMPVVTGIGHEIDFTIADFVADLRAPTPSVAAESISPDRYEIMQTIDNHLARITNQASQQLSRAVEKLTQVSRRLQLQHPQRQFAQLRIRLNHAWQTLVDRNRNRIDNDKHRLQLCQSIIVQSSPLSRIRRQREVLAVMNSNNVSSMKQRILVARHELALQAKSLDALSPLRTLSRGFAKITKNQKLVSSISQLAKGDEIEITLSDGSKQARVE